MLRALMLVLLAVIFLPPPGDGPDEDIDWPIGDVPFPAQGWQALFAVETRHRTRPR